MYLVHKFRCGIDPSMGGKSAVILRLNAHTKNAEPTFFAGRVNIKHNQKPLFRLYSRLSAQRAEDRIGTFRTFDETPPAPVFPLRKL